VVRRNNEERRTCEEEYNNSNIYVSVTCLLLYVAFSYSEEERIHAGSWCEEMKREAERKITYMKRERGK